MIDSGTAADRVLSQHPPPGTTVIRKTCADLLVSMGPLHQAFKMEDLTGFTLEMAIKQLERLQLRVGTISYAHTTLTPVGTIMDQVPLAGYRAVQGGPVDLTVNKGHNDPHPGNRGDADQVALFRFSLENGFLKKRVQVKIAQPHMSISLFDEFVAPGQEIWLLVPKSGNATVLVYVDGQLVQTRMMDGS
jgi:serine/threonine-protein kinase